MNRIAGMWLWGALFTGIPTLAAAQSLAVETNLLVARSGVAMTSAPLEVVYRHSDRARMAGVVVRATVPGTTLQLTNATAITDANGLARFDALTISGPIGTYQLAVRADTFRVMVPLNLQPGEPARLEIMTQPPFKTRHDSVLAPAVRVRAMDASANPIPALALGVSFCHHPENRRGLKGDDPATKLKLLMISDGSFRCGSSLDSLEMRQAPVGTTLRVTDAEGVATFDDLMIRGERGQYKLVFSPPALATLTDTSHLISYDPAEDFNRNYVVISAIKSIAGEIPDNEFFALRFRFTLRKRPPSFGLAPSVIAGIDLALTNRDNPDSVASAQKSLTEAVVQINLLSLLTTSTILDVPQRNLSFGGQFRVFNSIPYYGVQLGAVELGGSPFQGSQFSGGLLWRFSREALVDGDTVKVASHGLFADFLLASESIDFFKTLHVRGGVFLPLSGAVRELQSRLTIAVPVGQVRVF